MNSEYKEVKEFITNDEESTKFIRNILKDQSFATENDSTVDIVTAQARHSAIGGIMHYGVYKGIAADKQSKRILILGESHHDIFEEKGKSLPYTTKSIVETYLIQEHTGKTHRFFQKVARSFGINITDKSEEKKLFWDKVYFGNYIDVNCGVGDNSAKESVKKNRDKYNKELKDFVAREKIDCIFCFGVSTVYNCLPSEGWNKNAIYNDGKIIVAYQSKKVYLRAGIYEPDGYFERKVTVYGVPHPSAQGGFNPDHFVEELNDFFLE